MKIFKTTTTTTTTKEIELNPEVVAMIEKYVPIIGTVVKLLAGGKK